MDASLSTKIQLHLQCVGIKKLDLISKSDCFAVLYLQDPPADDMHAGLWREVYRTTTIQNSDDPDWPDAIYLDYHFESVQRLKIEVYDRDSSSEKLSAHDFVGGAETTVSKIMGTRGATFSAQLVSSKRGGKARGNLVVSAKEVSKNRDIMVFHPQASKLDRKNMGGFGKSDPFFEISYEKDNGGYVKVYTSAVVKKELSPKWKPVMMPVQQLNNGDYNKTLKFDIFDYEGSGDHKYIGSFVTTLSEMKTKGSFYVINEKKREKKGAKYTNSGVFEVLNLSIQEKYSFLDYVAGGCELRLMVAIDFTGSNGDPRDNRSLHYMAPKFTFNENVPYGQELNEYQKAIFAIGQILQDYDTDKMVPVYGFGGSYKGSVSHCFPLTLNEHVTEVKGVTGIMDVYKSAIYQIPLSGPTYFHHVLQKAIEDAGHVSQAQQHYNVLLILTDGEIHDMDETIDLLVRASEISLSVIIVGVGHADFDNMEALDGDGKFLRSGNKVARRDIVQFVPFSKFYSKGFSSLAQETLKEIPDQMLAFFEMKGIRPNKPQVAPLRYSHQDNDDKNQMENVPVAVVLDNPSSDIKGTMF